MISHTYMVAPALLHHLPMRPLFPLLFVALVGPLALGCAAPGEDEPSEDGEELSSETESALGKTPTVPGICTANVGAALAGSGEIKGAKFIRKNLPTGPAFELSEMTVKMMYFNDDHLRDGEHKVDFFLNNRWIGGSDRITMAKLTPIAFKPVIVQPTDKIEITFTFNRAWKRDHQCFAFYNPPAAWPDVSERM